MLTASGPFKLCMVHTSDERVSIRNELLRDDSRMLAYIEAEVGNFIELKIHMRREEHSHFTS